MKKGIYILSILCIWMQFTANAQSVQTETVIKSIYDKELSQGKCYGWLRELSVGIGARLSGSANADKAVQWAQKTLTGLNVDRVYLQEVMVPKWVRGKKEVCFIQVGKQKTNLSVCALGGSVGCPNGTVTGKVIEFKSLEEIQKASESDIKGKIVFFNRPMNPTFFHTFEAYGDAVGVRSRGAIEAAKKGAIATVIRSMSTADDDFPHTGAMRYDSIITKIPGAALSNRGADVLTKQLSSTPDMTLTLSMDCKTEPDVLSHNVVAEIKGSQYPDKIISVGGHLDSWDNGNGAHDDGAGCVQSIEVFYLFKQLNIRPKHTIRVVMFMNEENGLRGGKKYYDEAVSKKENHIYAIETDAGGFSPRSFDVDGTESITRHVSNFQPLFAPYGMTIEKGDGGADISYMKKLGCTLIGLHPDSQRYFDFHHAASDVFENVNQRELKLGAAAITSLIYLLDQNEQ